VIKCVIWDLDNTLLSGVYLESPDRPPPADPAMLGVLATLSGRGIIHAIASRNPPEAASYAEAATGHEFAAAECGWGRKSDAIGSILGELALAGDAVAFVDDEAHERAEVSFALPEVMVLSPEDMADAVGWPEFGPSVVTPEARRRGAMYAERRRRQAEARTFGGSREEFLRYSDTAVMIAPAGRRDVARLHELSVRTHQFNSTGEQVSAEALSALLGAADHRVITVRLSDRFGDDGMVGGCVVDVSGAAWTVTLLMMSCRAIGRGVIDALLAWLAQAAARDGAATLAVSCLVSDRNVPLRLALAGAGFRAGQAAAEGGVIALFSKRLSGPAPALPDWVSTPGPS
jgi:methoxymalonate biosynthesis protein